MSKVIKITLLLCMSMNLLILSQSAMSGGAEQLAKENKARMEKEAADEEAKSQKDMLDKRVYYPLNGDVVGNYKGGKKLGFVRLKMQLQLDGEDLVPIVQKHEPMLRHNILFVISEKTKSELASPLTREVFRKDILKLYKKLLEEETGSELIHEVLFTSFLVQ